MTPVDITFRFTVHPDETTLRAVNAIREVYGIRRILLREQAHTVTVEYDATRLNASVVARLLRGAGLDAEELPPPYASSQDAAQPPVNA